MKYKIKVTNQYYANNKDETKLMNRLKSIGFTFKVCFKYEDYVKYEVKRNGSIELNSLDDLNKFIKKWGKIVITGKTIEIYNGWRE